MSPDDASALPEGQRPAAGPPDAAAAHPTFTHREILVVFSGVLLGMFLAALDQTIVATALPTIADRLGGLEHLSWAVTAYLLTSTAVTPLFGKLSDLYGRSALFQAGIVFFLAGSLLCALAQDMAQFIAFRALQGIGGGGLMTLAQTIIADVVSPRERGRYQGYFAAVFTTSSVAGPLLGGFFTDHLSWHWIFLINLPIGAVAIAICRHALRKLTARRVRHRIDYAGAALMVAGVSCVLLVTSWGGVTFPWASAEIIGLVIAALVLLVAFIAQERRATEPILPLGLFRNDVFRTASMIMFLAMMAMFGAIIFLPVFLQLVMGATASHSGLLLMPLMIAIVVGATGAGRIMSRTGRYRRMPPIGLAIATGAFILMALMDADTPRLLPSAWMAVLGLGLGMIMPTCTVAAQNAVDMRDIGVATSSLNFFRSMGGSLGVALFGTIFAAHLTLSGGVAELGGVMADPAALPGLVSAFRSAFLLGAGLTAAAAVIAFLLLKDRPLRGSGPPPAEPAV